ncbi:hypothetical protein CFN78_02645 [Amycolatopsis antarctica]|uniref:Transmembrane protein n=1 Tax=Amycolatopsis antarctica TaxID=1854586 RepID=A0A263D9N9_9PSEU|nr:hypothetical protein [Amycolatopsis antarctica]OZM75091.1 hypothetical protein CFN78_02645 [Amycolatopsis antarctica]
MSDTPELDQVVDARRKLSTYAELSRTYWAVHGVALVLIAGIPIWLSFLPGQSTNLQWVLLAVCLVSAAYSVIQRQRSGVALPRRIGAYPSARKVRFAVLAVTLASVGGIYALVENGHRVAASVILVPVAAFILVGQIWTRARMRDDIAAGRIAL